MIELVLNCKSRRVEITNLSNYQGEKTTRKASRGVVWCALKLSNFSTIFREYLALHCVERLPFVDIIMSGKQTTQNKDTNTEISENLQTVLKMTHNESQIAALNSCLGKEPIVLIQV